MNRNARRRAARGACLALLATLAVTWVGATAVQAADSPISDKLKKQIGVMEKVIDEVLVESPNLLVYSSEATRGVYLDEFGVLFTLEASLVEEGWKNKLKFFDKLKIEEEDGKIIIHRGDDDEETVENIEDWQDKQNERNQALYAKGKQELAEVLAEYGETLTGLRDDQSVGVAAFLKGSGYFVDKRISRLVLRAKMSDLRAYASKRITTETMHSRLVVEEY
jgi:adenylate kinase family enzyme